MKHSHCSYCGSKYTCEDWPRQCSACKKMMWLNPFPVVVLLVPIEQGILLVRRGEEPAKNELALPGGYLNCKETWRHGGAREVLEETGINIHPETIILETVIGPMEDDDHILIFGRAPKQSIKVLEAFKSNNELLNW